LAWYPKELAIREFVLGKNHPLTAATTRNTIVVAVLEKKEDYDGALVWFKKTLNVLESASGKEVQRDAQTSRIIGFG
jgi:hypothetical protein